MIVSLMRKLPVLVLASLAAGGAFGSSIALMSTGDTDISESPADNNNGGSTTFTSGANGRVERSRGLIRFDLTDQIPGNASIQAVSLTLVCTQVPGMGPADSTFDLHRLLVDWGEGTGFNPDNDFGRPALSGEATWNNRFHPSSPWSVPGAAAPGDFSSAVSSSVFVQGVGAYAFPTSAAMVAAVQAWVLRQSVCEFRLDHYLRVGKCYPEPSQFWLTREHHCREPAHLDGAICHPGHADD